MNLKKFRHAKYWSQEELSLASGLSVRTIQRIEAGGTASKESLKCLSAALEVEISKLEEVVKVIDKTTEDWQKVPRWLRAYFFGSGALKVHERRFNIGAEIVLTVAGLGCLAASPFIPHSMQAGFALFTAAYFVSLFTRAGDKYSIW